LQFVLRVPAVGASLGAVAPGPRRVASISRRTSAETVSALSTTAGSECWESDGLLFAEAAIRYVAAGSRRKQVASSRNLDEPKQVIMEPPDDFRVI
jgi:hypothetical protein